MPVCYDAVCMLQVGERFPGSLLVGISNPLHQVFLHSERADSLPIDTLHLELFVVTHDDWEWSNVVGFASISPEMNN